MNLNSWIDSLKGQTAVIDFAGINSTNKQNLFQFSIFDRDALNKTLQEIQSAPLKSSESKSISKTIIIDRAYSLDTLKNEREIFYVQDHVNLSTLNPLIGPVNKVGEPRFFPVNKIYLKPSDLRSSLKKDLESENINGCMVAGLNLRVKPHKNEIKILSEVGISHYCYNLVLSSLMAAHKGFQILGLLVVEN